MIVNVTPFLNALRDIRSQHRKMTIEYVSRQQVTGRCCLCCCVLDTSFVLCWKCFHYLHPEPVNFRVSPVVEYAGTLSSVLKDPVKKDSKRHGVLNHEFKLERYNSRGFDEVSSHKQSCPTELKDVPLSSCGSGNNVFVPGSFHSCNKLLTEEQATLLHAGLETSDGKNWLKRLRYLGLDSNNLFEDLCLAFLTHKLESMSRDERTIVGNVRRRMDLNATRRWHVFQCRSRMEVIDEQLSVLRLGYLLFLRDLKLDDALALKDSIIEMRRNKKHLFIELEKYFGKS